MPGPRRAIVAGGALAAVLLVTACGSTNYNTDLAALAGAVEHASHGSLTRLTCAGVVPYQRQKQIKARSHYKGEYRYFCHGETTGPGAPKAVTKVIRVSLDGKHWREDTTEEAEEARERARRGER
jgi:hypothetical protein